MRARKDLDSILLGFGRPGRRKGYFLTIFDDAGPLGEGFHGTNMGRLMESALNSLGYVISIGPEPVDGIEYYIVGAKSKPAFKSDNEKKRFIARRRKDNA